ncbi:hypothetical protein Tco_0506108 [Tanacetum coccineum]
MKDRDMTMKEYVQFETDRALRNGKVYNWETTTYGKIWYDEDVHYLRFVETEFPVIVYNDALASKSGYSSEPAEESANKTRHAMESLRLEVESGDILRKYALRTRLQASQDLVECMHNETGRVNKKSIGKYRKLDLLCSASAYESQHKKMLSWRVHDCIPIIRMPLTS